MNEGWYRKKSDEVPLSNAEKKVVWWFFRAEEGRSDGPV
jgi:hypothetical protein